ncbi:hypothetical protein SAMN04487820_10148 [Actinopolyspora mzabensis]|uniref:Uncharacterized protein n=1 Tax=Actinopolyspora mzabensis TaxID=995066 RepID=A0A1G8VFL6_ACTMZ|nr:hypothetical protein SAMN04487820_10148 [Actinopolyspora mzabensis]
MFGWNRVNSRLRDPYTPVFRTSSGFRGAWGAGGENSGRAWDSPPEAGEPARDSTPDLPLGIWRWGACCWDCRWGAWKSFEEAFSGNCRPCSSAGIVEASSAGGAVGKSVQLRRFVGRRGGPSGPGGRDGRGRRFQGWFVGLLGAGIPGNLEHTVDHGVRTRLFDGISLMSIWLTAIHFVPRNRRAGDRVPTMCTVDRVTLRRDIRPWSGAFPHGCFPRVDTARSASSNPVGRPIPPVRTVPFSTAPFPTAPFRSASTRAIPTADFTQPGVISRGPATPSAISKDALVEASAPRRET